MYADVAETSLSLMKLDTALTCEMMSLDTALTSEVKEMLREQDTAHKLLLISLYNEDEIALTSEVICDDTAEIVLVKEVILPSKSDETALSWSSEYDDTAEIC